MTRSGRLAALAVLLAGPALAGCAPAAPPASPGPRVDAPAAPLATRPLTGLVPAALLRWMLVARPHELFASRDLAGPIGRVVPGRGLDALVESTGVDLRALSSAVVAGFDQGTLYLGEGTIDPPSVERHFRERLLSESNRSELRPDLVHVSGVLGAKPRALALFDGSALGVSVGAGDPLRIAEAYALGRLRSPKALAHAPLAEIAAALGDAPLLGFAPGPFEGEWERGAHHLLRAATGVGAAVRPTGDGGLALTAVLAGDWSADPARAASLLRETWDELAASPVGHLSGLASPRKPVTIQPSPGLLKLTTVLDADALAQGLEASVSAQIRSIMK